MRLARAVPCLMQLAYTRELQDDERQAGGILLRLPVLAAEILHGFSIDPPRATVVLVLRTAK